MSPFNPEKSTAAAPGKVHGVVPVAAACAALLRQHRRPGPAPASWETVTAGHTPNPLWAPVLGESPPVLHEEAELRGCHQLGLPGPGLDRDFLWFLFGKGL